MGVAPSAVFFSSTYLLLSMTVALGMCAAICGVLVAQGLWLCMVLAFGSGPEGAVAWGSARDDDVNESLGASPSAYFSPAAILIAMLTSCLLSTGLYIGR